MMRTQSSNKTISDYLQNCILKVNATEMLGTSVVDSTGNRSCTLTAGTLWTTGYSGNGAFITDRTHLMSTNATGIAGLNSYTWITIAKPTSFYTGLAGVCLTTTAGYQYLGFSPTQGWYMDSYYNLTTYHRLVSNINTLNNWYFVAIQRTSGSLNIFVKNLSTQSTLTKFTMSTVTTSAYWGSVSAFEVGRIASNYSFQGEIDLVQLFNTNLSEQLINQICEFNTIN
jgi:hypothetical protein